MAKCSREERTAKLLQAQQMVAEGKHQRDIAKALNISVMTYHRWRKATSAGPGAEHRISELLLENSRLRRLLTDLLLEKIELEEGSVNDVQIVGSGHAVREVSTKT